MNQGAFEWGFEPNEVGLHTFSVRAIDFEGNVGAATTFTWRILGVTVEFTDGPGFTPATRRPAGRPGDRRPDGEHVRRDPVRVERLRRHLLVPLRQPRPGRLLPVRVSVPRRARARRQHDFPDALTVGDHMLEVFAESELMGSAAELEPAVYEWEVVESDRHDAAGDLPRARARPGRPELDDLRVLRHRRPDAAVPAHLRVPGHGRHGAAERERLGRVLQPVQPARRLLVRRPADAALAAHLLRARDRHVRARVPGPDEPRGRGQPRPDAGVRTPGRRSPTRGRRS